MARLRTVSSAALVLFAQFCVAALARKGDHPPAGAANAGLGLTTARAGWRRVVLQTDGSAELVERYSLHLNAGAVISDFEYFQISSHPDCLNVSRGLENVLATQTKHGTNVTSTLSFDNMVGVVNYTLGIRNKRTKKVVYSKVVEYTVVGMVLYLKNKDGSRNVLNTEGSAGFKITYQEALKKKIRTENEIHCFIQYADGTSTNDLKKGAKKVQKGTTLISSAPVTRHQFHHTTSQCDADAIGSYSRSKGIKLPKGCGFGFYWNPKGELCFGFNFHPYRIGKAKLHWAWSGLTYSSGDLAEEIYECNMNVDVTGIPPIAVKAVEPTKRLFRYEGGETIKCTFINADLHKVSRYRFEIGKGVHCPMVPGSLGKLNRSEYTQSAVFVVQPGRGGPFQTVLQYSETNDTTATTSTFKNAKMLVKFPLKYDEKLLYITKMSPMSGSEDGGATVTLAGYFGHFTPDRDSIEFSGMKIPAKYITSASSSKIKFKLPPKSVVGEAYEYKVSVHVGNGVSNKVRFFYRMRGGVARISQSGTSYLRDNTYRAGDCTPLRFTLMIAPLTPEQIKGFRWTLIPANGTQTDLFTSLASLKDIDTTQPTIEIYPKQMGSLGNFILTGRIIMHTHVVKKEISIQRDNVVSIGAFILKPAARYKSYPRTPISLIAVVNAPGNCYTGGPGMIYEWSIFGKTYQFSPTKLSSKGRTGPLEIQVARLGRELLIPQEYLVHGNHKVTFRVQMADQADVFGEAETILTIKKDKLVPIIRNGESEMNVNTHSNITIFATNSYDPDLNATDRTLGIAYAWTCNQSTTANFTELETKPCSTDILPLTAVNDATFTIGEDALGKVGDHKFLRFFLFVSKGNDVQNTTMDCTVTSGPMKPTLDRYSFTLEDSDGYPVPFDHVPPYEDIILRPSAPGTSWTYTLLEPQLPDFKFYEMLQQRDTMFAPGADQGSFGNVKPLGLAAMKLGSHTRYKIRVTFAGTSRFASTSCVVSFMTSETPTLGILNPTPRNGDTLTQFTATAGLPMADGRFAYYFHLTDLEGNQFCAGGCTGYNIAHFSVMRPGTYSLTVSLYDKRGRALLDRKTMPTPIVISLSGREKEFLPMLSRFFQDGDDAAWAQLAHDITLPPTGADAARYEALVLLGGRPPLSASPGPLETPLSAPLPALPVPAGREQAGEPSPSPSAVPDPANERLTAARAETAGAIAADARGITCSSVTNSQQGRSALDMLSRLLRGDAVGKPVLFNCLYVLLCAVENAPAGGGVDARDALPGLLARFFAHAQRLDAAGFRAARDAGASARPGNVFADIAVVTGRLFARAVAAGRADGFAYAAALGARGEFGHIALFAGSAPEHLPAAAVNGETRRVVPGRSPDELFYIRPQRFGAVFSRRPADKRYIALHTVPNFVVRGRLQDEPPGNNLADDLYWVQMFAAGRGGGLRALRPTVPDPAFCMRIPVARHRALFHADLGVMPGMYRCGDIKQVGERARAKGEYFNYVHTGFRVVEYNVSQNENWVEACHNAPGLFGATAVSRTGGGAQAVGLERAVLIGQQGSLLAALVTGGLLLVVFAIAAAWLVAINSGKATPGAVPGGYVERDGYGRQGAAPAAGPGPSGDGDAGGAPVASAGEDVVSAG